MVPTYPDEDAVDTAGPHRYRIKDATTGRHLEQQARAVNRVWNYCGEVQEAARQSGAEGDQEHPGELFG